MSNILTIAYTTEGPTDVRFLKTIIQKVFEEIAFECEGLIEVYEPVHIKFPKKDTFVNGFVRVSKAAKASGINVLCIHADADSNRDDDALEFKIVPGIKAINDENNISVCKTIVAIIPVHMTEAWMLADKELLKEEIGTNLSNTDLGINRSAESIADPKKIIEDALIIAQQDLPKRRNKILIEDLYQPIGQKISIAKLKSLDSFNKFELSVKSAFMELNYLH